jgi:hypothetical protein
MRHGRPRGQALAVEAGDVAGEVARAPGCPIEAKAGKPRRQILQDLILMAGGVRPHQDNVNFALHEAFSDMTAIVTGIW